MDSPRWTTCDDFPSLQERAEVRGSENGCLQKFAFRLVMDDVTGGSTDWSGVCRMVGVQHVEVVEDPSRP